jgi:hypothetical protein
MSDLLSELTLQRDEAQVNLQGLDNPVEKKKLRWKIEELEEQIRNEIRISNLTNEIAQLEHLQLQNDETKSMILLHQQRLAYYHQQRAVLASASK